MRPFFARVLREATGPQLLFSAAAAVALAGCSSSADRLVNHSSSNEAIYTASVPKSIQQEDGGGYVSAPIEQASVTRQPLSNENATRSYQPPQQTYAEPVYRQPTYQQPKTLAAPQPQIAAVTTESMRAQNGEVQIEPGMTLFAVGKANNVSVRSLADANGMAPPYAVRTGQVIRMPGSGDATIAAAPTRTKAGGSHKVQPGETLFSLGRKYGVSPYAIADLNDVSPSSPLSVGEALRIPAGSNRTIASAPVEESVTEENNQATIVKTETETPPVEVTAEDEVKPKDQSQIAAVEAPRETPAVVDPALPGFRWPVKGKIISAYGAKPNGLRNEGINIAVPEGTSVRAADSGVVAYAGNELKGYGNLVLIRHEGGWVTAYAHNKELFVKRGDTVKRGDVLAKAGQTGSVSSPQVHFEIRKGATAMDPVRFLSASTAAN